MSTTSRSNWLGIYLSHSARRFSTDWRERGVCPVMYSRRAYRVTGLFAALPRVRFAAAFVFGFRLLLAFVFMLLPYYFACERTSRPTRTRWVSERSPIILRIG